MCHRCYYIFYIYSIVIVNEMLHVLFFSYQFKLTSNYILFLFFIFWFSFYNWETQTSTSSPTPNYQVIAENASGLLFKNKRDRKIINVDPKVCF